MSVAAGLDVFFRGPAACVRASVLVATRDVYPGLWSLSVHISSMNSPVYILGIEIFPRETVEDSDGRRVR